ncbi:MAG: hypothetical protein J6K99_07120 [Peptococcaceae bacterium]|nr:hypothetical protein [Peptococcaceae bacterium]
MYKKFIKEISALQARFITEIVKLADKYDCDRNDAVLMALENYVVMCECANFENYFYEEEGAEHE